MRRFTFITLICLFVLLAAAAILQLAIAAGHHGPFPGPVSGTPLPRLSPTS